ncbi:MAG TPA: fatty acid desaturase [Puia sp.]|nr:fatty acid desaturase [Puia sp.]
MLKFKEDIKTLIYLVLATAILFVQWNTGFFWPVYILSLYFAITVAVIAHNHNHVPMWKSSTLNDVTDIWITLFYGFPAFAWTPTHNKNHHKFNNKDGDYTITYRISERNNIFTLLSYPSISSYFQQSPVMNHLKHLYKNKRNKFYLAILQYLCLGLLIVGTLLLDWRKSLLYIVIPQQVALFTVMIFNYIQHVHADEESPVNHSRNFVSKFTNFMMFNNGFHTVHHNKASLHWSKLPEAHARIAHTIAPHLNQQVILIYLFKTYIIAPFRTTYKTTSMRLSRKSAEISRKFSPEPVQEQ